MWNLISVIPFPLLSYKERMEDKLIWQNWEDRKGIYYFCESHPPSIESICNCGGLWAVVSIISPNSGDHLLVHLITHYGVLIATYLYAGVCYLRITYYYSQFNIGMKHLQQRYSTVPRMCEKNGKILFIRTLFRL